MSMSEVRPKFSVIVPVLNSSRHLRTCLDSILLAAQRHPGIELIVLDNGSQDGSYELLLRDYSDRACVQQIPGIPVSALRNRGAQLARGEFLAFLDSDCTISLDYFEQAQRILQRGAAATGSQCALPEHPHWVEETWHNIHTDQCDGFVKYVNSGNFVVRRDTFVTVGGFNETMISSEDCELGARLNLAGFKIYQAQAVRAIHLNGDKSLPTFFRKSAWRSMGMFGMFRNSWISKPVFINAVHLLLCLAGIALLFVPQVQPLSRVALFVALVNLAPALSVLYQASRRKRVSPALLLRAMVLYHTYFLARFYITGKMIASSLGLSGDKIAFSVRLHSAHQPQTTQPDSPDQPLPAPPTVPGSAASAGREGVDR